VNQSTNENKDFIAKEINEKSKYWYLTKDIDFTGLSDYEISEKLYNFIDENYQYNDFDNASLLESDIDSNSLSCRALTELYNQFLANQNINSNIVYGLYFDENNNPKTHFWLEIHKDTDEFFDADVCLNLSKDYHSFDKNILSKVDFFRYTDLNEQLNFFYIEDTNVLKIIPTKFEPVPSGNVEASVHYKTEGILSGKIKVVYTIKNNSNQIFSIDSIYFNDQKGYESSIETEENYKRSVFPYDKEDLVVYYDTSDNLFFKDESIETKLVVHFGLKEYEY